MLKDEHDRIKKDLDKFAEKLKDHGVSCHDSQILTWINDLILNYSPGGLRNTDMKIYIFDYFINSYEDLAT